MPRRENRSRRRGPLRTARPRLLVVIGSLRTEQDYLIGLRDSAGTRAVDIQLVRKAKSPTAVVAYAANFVARAPDDFDEVWCVYDVDEFEVEPASREAARHRFQLAVSDPCFELWLLLHHEDCAAFLNGYREVERRLRKHLPGYDKTRLDFADHADGVGDAIRRAEKLGDSGNPSTDMWRLATRIRTEEEQ
ncbi:RloB family protein [Kribbella solani]|uniref:RloB family protein n=1 Tax=Kribbella solani TaxID=236067 RepID=UPI0029AAB92F|nr:RloB family protein [Kribbella solani]MDX2967809.1 RloB family protein [Kribbella solani]MDX3005322.1 RloB family protein [Kribbella solani]